MDNIKKELQKVIHKMVGEYVIKSSHYEKELCSLLSWKCVDDRYYDAYNGESYIELKKGQSSMWFNMVRYAEIQTKIGRQGTVTLFVKYNKKKKRVTEIYIIDTKRILSFLNMVPTKAACCIILSKDCKRNLDMQAGATAKDLKEMANFVVINPMELYDKCMIEIIKYNKRKRKRKRN